MILTIISEHEEAKKVNEELEDSHDNDNNNQAILKKMIIPSDLNDTQLGATHVCNCDEVGVGPNRRWDKFIYTYKLFQVEKMWKMQTGERAPFWCTLLVFTRSGGKCFMSPIISIQSKKYSQDIYYTILL